MTMDGDAECLLKIRLYLIRIKTSFEYCLLNSEYINSYEQ
jgi:hypothetical protein